MLTISEMRSVIAFDRLLIKFATCPLPRGSIIPAISLSASIKMISLITGEMIVAIRSKSPAPPTAFLMSEELARIREKPSEIYEPTMGTYDLIAYLAVLIDIPSTEPAEIP